MDFVNDSTDTSAAGSCSPQHTAGSLYATTDSCNKETDGRIRTLHFHQEGFQTVDPISLMTFKIDDNIHVTS